MALWIQRAQKLHQYPLSRTQATGIHFDGEEIQLVDPSTSPFCLVPGDTSFVMIGPAFYLNGQLQHGLAPLVDSICEIGLPMAPPMFFSAHSTPQVILDPREIPDGACPLCGDPLVAPVIICAQCGVAHHQECFQETATCTTYGCNQQTHLDDSAVWTPLELTMGADYGHTIA